MLQYVTLNGKTVALQQGRLVTKYGFLKKR
jgi:hypothetical protein